MEQKIYRRTNQKKRPGTKRLDRKRMGYSTGFYKAVRTGHPRRQPVMGTHIPSNTTTKGHCQEQSH